MVERPWHHEAQPLLLCVSSCGRQGWIAPGGMLRKQTRLESKAVAQGPAIQHLTPSFRVVAASSR